MKNLMFYLVFLFIGLPLTAQYSWQIQQAKVLPKGDLEWSPKAFVLEKGSDVRYIDYEAGNNSNDGLSTSTAWKHHPWDNQASGNAASSNGVKTYIFKRGVVYRGSLVADESGTVGNPIRLTSDPAWGSGEASIYGSVRVTSGWTKSSAAISPKIPTPTQVWYRNISGVNNSKVVCEIDGNTIRRVRVARIPNYHFTADEPMKLWWAFDFKTKEGNGTLSLRDSKNMIQTSANYFAGGSVWAIEDVTVMCTLWKQNISSYNPSTNSINVPDQNFGGLKCKYFIENTPYLLDTTSEYYYDNSLGRMYLRLEKDKDPNTAIIEIANRQMLLDLNSRSNIEVSGLSFKFTSVDQLRYGTNDGIATIKIEGNGSNISIKNCKFQYVNGGVLANGASNVSSLTNIEVSDNEMENMDDFSIFMNSNSDYFLNNIKILRNKVYESGTRHQGRWYSSIPAIWGQFVDAEIAGNIVEYSWGSGINIMWGKSMTDNKTIPFVRGLVHHNKVNHSLIGVNDYGGIEGWQGGPAFYYNNISHDASGYKYSVGSSLGYAFYFDGAFKQAVFNNIATGKGWKKNGALYTQVLGFYNVWANNNAYNAASFSSSGGEAIAPDGQNIFLSNISDSTESHFNNTTKASGIPFESYSNNIFSNTAFNGNFINSGSQKNFDEFVSGLQSYKADVSQLGWEVNSKAFTNASNNDFSPPLNSEVIDKGVKYYLPFPLSRVVEFL